MSLQFSDVYVKEHYFINSLKVLCEYLRFTSMSDFHKWTENVRFKLIMNLFLAANKVCFDLTDSECKREKTVSVKKIMKKHEDLVILRMLLIIFFLDIINFKKNVSLLCYFYIIYRIIKEFSEWFLNSHQKFQSCAEDIHCCVYFLKFLIKIKIISCKSTEKQCDE